MSVIVSYKSKKFKNIFYNQTECYQHFMFTSSENLSVQQKLCATL